MPHPHLIFDHVSFWYDAGGMPVLADACIEFPHGWTGVVGPNGSGKTTLLDLVRGALPVTEGSIRGHGLVTMIEQRTDHAPANVHEFIHAHDGRARRLHGRLDIGWDWNERWETLSHGERKRLQLACALWQRPDILLIDEPTNHVDRDARDVIIESLRSHQGIGIIVSHDRALLDELCTNCLMIERPTARLYPGGYSTASDLAQADRERAQREHAKARKEVKRLQKEAAARAHVAEQADARRSKRGISVKDHDAKSRIDAARVSGKDGHAGRLLSQMQGRLDQASASLDRRDAHKERRLGIAFQGRSARRDVLVELEGGRIELGDGRTLRYPELTVRPNDRIALSGPNGAGKSTLIGALRDAMALDDSIVTYVPQELSEADIDRLIERLHELDDASKGSLLTIVSRLGSSPDAVIESQRPSPGEARKLLLGLGILGETALIILDEPTNHLDLPSIECLESALAECPAALLLVSHDERFLTALATTRWVIQDGVLRPG